ncbi:MAG: TetR/AcrR family transcriptional regulator [Acidimicrobiales bacterium]
MTGDRPLRADAQRNRRRILQAAEEVFARDGLSVAVDEVARHAGVGVGTLYRHFPTKEALFEAIVETRLGDLVEACDVHAPGGAGEALFTFLEKMAELVARKHDLYDALSAAGVDFKSRCADQVACLEAGLDRLRREAVVAGEVRADVTTPQVLGLVIGACVGSDRSGMEARSCHQMLRVVFDGLRARSGAEAATPPGSRG